MSTIVTAKKSVIVVLFILFSLIFVGGIFGVTYDTAISAGQELSYPSWLVISYLAGLSMIILPCTLPLVFIIVPLSMGKGGKKGLTMAGLFGDATLTITSSKNNPTVEVRFSDIYPVALSSLEFNQQATDVDYLTAQCTFSYTLYELFTL